MDEYEVLSAVENVIRSNEKQTHTCAQAATELVVNRFLIERDIDDLMGMINYEFATFPGTVDFSQYKPYISCDYDSGESEYRVELAYYLYPNDARVYDWTMENAPNLSMNIALSHNGKKLYVNWEYKTDLVTIKVSYDAILPDEDVWMLRSIGKIQVTEQVVRNESLVCTK